MLKRYYAIYDKVAKTYSGLFEQQNDAVASRLFESQQKNKDSFISVKPEDFQLLDYHFLYLYLVALLLLDYL